MKYLTEWKDCVADNEKTFAAGDRAAKVFCL